MDAVRTRVLEIKVADEVWVAVALLHREHSDADDFSVDEIVERAKQVNLYGSLRPGVYVHVVQHCVANRPPNPGRYRMLLETSEGRRRLFRRGDAEHPERRNAKIVPAREALPAKYSQLVDWYEAWASEAPRAARQDPLLELKGSGRRIWADEGADAYVNRLRAGWK